MFKNFIFLLPCFVCVFSAITLFFRRKKNSRSQNIWMIFMLLLSVPTYTWGWYYSGNIENFSFYYKLDVLDSTFGLTMFPLIRLYFKSLTDESPLKWKEEYRWFLPALFIGVSSAIIYAYMGDEQATIYIEAALFKYKDLSEFTAPVYKIHMLVDIIPYYVIWTIQLFIVIRYTITGFINYRKRLGDYFSNPEGKSLENIKAMLIALFVLLMIFLLGITELVFFSQHYLPLMYILLSVVAGLLYYLSYLVISVPYTAENLATELLQLDKEAEEQGYAGIADMEEESCPAVGIKNHKREELIEQINFLLDKEKLFLQKDLRLNDLVRLTLVNRSYVSLVINEEYQCTFVELINGKRVTYAKELALANPKMSHAHIADKSGFAHPSSFSRVFKQQEGMTFKEWHREKVG